MALNEDALNNFEALESYCLMFELGLEFGEFKFHSWVI